MKPKPGDSSYRDSGDDFRYSMDVYLVREGRPRYWEFHCIYCGTKVCEVQGTAIYGIDVTNNQSSTRQKCLGKPPKFCRMWYHFIVV